MSDRELEQKKLDLGCGKNKIRGTIGIDFNPSTQADVVHDLTIFPYPFEDNLFEEIYCRHILEHLPNLIAVMEELHRIAKPGCRIFVEVPYWSSHRAFKDPTHVLFFTENSFDYFCSSRVGYPSHHFHDRRHCHCIHSIRGFRRR